MKFLGPIYLILVSACSFLHYPLSLIFPYGADNSVHLVFIYEFPHVFVASVLSLAYVLVHLNQLEFQDKLLRIILVAISLILISGLIYGAPIYRIIETSAFFTVPLGVFLALKNNSGREIIFYIISSLFLLNLVYCLLFSGKIGIAGNQNWLAASLITSLPFFVLSIKKFPKKILLPLVAVVGALSLFVLIKTSARALVPAIGIFIFYFCVQRKSIKFNLAVFGSLAFLLLAVCLIKSEKIQRVLNQDIRGPLAKDTVSLILSTSLLGTGPGNFQRDFPEYASETLKKRINYSSIVEHPHNEFLNIAANSGIPVALIWVVFLLKILGKREDFEGVAIQFAVITGFMMGLADKPLTESPSAIIFLIACGMLIPDSFKKAKLNENSAIKVLGPSLALACIIFGIVRTQADVRSRYHFWKGEGLRAQMNSSNQLEIVADMFDHFRKSSEIDPTFINAAYNSATISLYFYRSLSQDQKLLEKMIALEPDYSDFNKWVGLYYRKQASLLGEGDEKKLTEAEAEKYYLRNQELSPWNINRSRELVRFYAGIGNDDQVIQWIYKCREIARERLSTLYTHTDRVDMEGDLKNWVTKVSQGDKPGFVVLDGMKANEGGDYLKFDVFNRTNNLRSYFNRPLPELDRQFWSRRLQLTALMKQQDISSVKDILNSMVSIEIDKSSIKWPLDTFKDKQGSLRSVVSLACSLNSLLGNSSAILTNEKGITLCVLFDQKNCWIWNPGKGELLQTGIENFHKDSELRRSLSGQAEDDFEYELFCYPEAFCLRNQLVSDLVSINPEVPAFCISPSLEKLLLKKKIGDRKIRYANKHIGLLDSAAAKLLR